MADTEQYNHYSRKSCPDYVMEYCNKYLKTKCGNIACQDLKAVVDEAASDGYWRRQRDADGHTGHLIDGKGELNG